jgi:methylmalonyl-CoA mutase
MAEDRMLQKIRETFPKATKEDWKQAARHEIDGKDPIETLRWSAGSELDLSAYYDKSDTLELDYLKKFQINPSSDVTGFPRSWVNLPKINVTNSATANQLALHHLQHGAEGIWFDLTSQPAPEIALLLEKIEWPYCTLSFQLAEKNIFLLSNYIVDKNYDSNSLTGAIFWQLTPRDVKRVVDSFTHQKKIHTLGLIIPPSSPVNEISEALSSAVALLDKASTEILATKTLVRNIAFSIPVGTNFFLEIAKIKALRMLWVQVAHAFGEKDYTPADVHIHTRSEVWTNEKFQPHANMLKSTTASMAAVLGGCDSLTVQAEDESSAMMNRIARNVSNILRDESHLNKVADAVAGSYAVDNLVNEIAQKAWAEFQVKSSKS